MNDSLFEEFDDIEITPHIRRYRSTVYSPTSYVHDNAPVEIQDTEILWHPKYLFRKMAYKLGMHSTSNRNDKENDLSIQNEKSYSKNYEASRNIDSMNSYNEKNNYSNKYNTSPNTINLFKDVTNSTIEKVIDFPELPSKSRIYYEDQNVEDVNYQRGKRSNINLKVDTHFRKDKFKESNNAEYSLNQMNYSFEKRKHLGPILASNTSQSIKSDISSPDTTSLSSFPLFEDQYSNFEESIKMKRKKWYSRIFDKSQSIKTNHSKNNCESALHHDSLSIKKQDENIFNLSKNPVPPRCSFSSILESLPETNFNETYSTQIQAPRYSYHPKFKHVTSPTRHESEFDSFSENDILILQKIKEIDIQIYSFLDKGVDKENVETVANLYEQFDECYHSIHSMHRALICKFSITYKKRKRFSKQISKLLGKKLVALPEPLEKSTRVSIFPIYWISNLFCLPCTQM